MNFSLTQIGNYVALIAFILGLLKVNISTEEISRFVEAGAVVVGLVVSWVGRYRQGDITALGFKK